MPSTFDKALRDGITMLIDLPRDRSRAWSAAARIERFRKKHPNAGATLLLDQPPGSSRLDYDLLLNYPKGGTVGLTYQPDSGHPWCVEYAEHWAANFVVSVNKKNVTVQEALLFLNLQAQSTPDLMNLIINKELIAQEIEKSPTPVKARDIQSMADAYRIFRGLHSADATRRWLHETGISEERFWKLCGSMVLERKLRQRIAGRQIKPYFHTHRKTLEVVHLVKVVARSRASAGKIMVSARQRNLLYALADWMKRRALSLVDARLIRCRARDLDSSLADASAGAIIGPMKKEDGYWVVQVLARENAVLDASTRWEIRDLLFSEWLEHRRREATVQWHWT